MNLPSSYTIYLITHYLDDIFIMRSSSCSPPFAQYEDGMVGEAPLLNSNMPRVLREENIPRPTLLEGSTPEMSFVKEYVHGLEQRLVDLQARLVRHQLDSYKEVEALRNGQLRIVELEVLFEHFVDKHYLPLQRAFFLLLRHQCPCGRYRIQECRCGRPLLVEVDVPFSEYLTPPVHHSDSSSSGSDSSHYSPTTDASVFRTPEEGEEVPIPIPYRLEGPTEEEAVFLRATLYPEQSDPTRSYAGDNGFSGDSG